jgi:hypothetical protein
MGKVKTGHIKEYTNPPKSDAKNAEFIVFFRETATYNGGFGIDYMSGEPSKLKGSETKYREIESNNWADFEKLYNPTKIYNQPYYTTWISMYKDNFSVTGEQVKLSLYIDKISGNWDNKEVIDEIVFAPKEGLRFVPERMAAKNAHKTEITVFCDTELSSNFVYEVKDQNGNVIGVLNFYNNAVRAQRHLNVKLISTTIDGTYPQINQNDVEKWLNKQGLNQGMIQCNIILENYDVRVDPKSGSIPAIPRDPIKNITRFNIMDTSNKIVKRYDFYNIIITDYVNQNQNDSSDLRYFFVNLEAVGAATTDPDESSYANGEYVKNSLWKGKDVFLFHKGYSAGFERTTIIHEGLHALGVEHFFSNGLGKENGKFYFDRFSTDNIMDYIHYGAKDPRKRTIKWQWDLIR